MPRTWKPTASSLLVALVLSGGSLESPPRAFATELWFATDPGTQETEFGLDLVVPVLRTPGGRAWIAGSYAQRSLWDLANDDDPFRVETNFEPGVLLRIEVRDVEARARDPLRGVAVELGFHHESNGLENELSRGWNRWQATVELRWQEAWRLALTGWRGFRVEDTNAQLLRDRGDGRCDLTWTPTDRRWRVLARAAWASPGRGGVLIPNFGARVGWRGAAVERVIPALPGFGSPWLLLAARAGTGEFLSDPGDDRTVLRVGLAFGSGER